VGEKTRSNDWEKREVLPVMEAEDKMLTSVLSAGDMTFLAKSWNLLGFVPANVLLFPVRAASNLSISFSLRRKMMRVSSTLRLMVSFLPGLRGMA